MVGIVCTLDGRRSLGRGLSRLYSSSERFGRALKAGGLWLLVAFLAVFVPVLHFILVPLFILLSLVFGVSIWIEKGELVEGEFICPNCNHLNRLEHESDDWPKQRRCSGCSFLLTISADSSVEQTEKLSLAKGIDSVSQ